MASLRYRDDGGISLTLKLGGVLFVHKESNQGGREILLPGYRRNVWRCAVDSLYNLPQQPWPLGWDWCWLVDSPATATELHEQGLAALVVDDIEAVSPVNHRGSRHSPDLLHLYQAGKRYSWSQIGEKRFSRHEKLGGEFVRLRLCSCLVDESRMQNQVTEFMGERPTNPVTRMSPIKKRDRFLKLRASPVREGLDALLAATIGRLRRLSRNLEEPNPNALNSASQMADRFVC